MYQPPPRDCPLCPRLAAFREANRVQFPDWHNGAVPSFGTMEAELLVVGLAPGLRGANCTGRPFTGDYAGLVLYKSLLTNGFATGNYAERPDDGLTLVNCRITNAVRCVPPENKPTPEETTLCRDFLRDEIAAMPNLKAILALGTISHRSVSVALGLKQSQLPFKHGAEHTLGKLTLFDSYHCSRYNINTGRLTQEMFDSVTARARTLLSGSTPPAA
ncbi:MAG: uracil-DNA glycosylase [Alphaproteobacteria bacterium]|nr:uracil-DNA glycosylase [Alphaproteobacteria bacterium]